MDALHCTSAFRAAAQIGRVRGCHAHLRYKPGILWSGFHVKPCTSAAVPMSITPAFRRSPDKLDCAGRCPYPLQSGHMPISLMSGPRIVLIVSSRLPRPRQWGHCSEKGGACSGDEPVEGLPKPCSAPSGFIVFNMADQSHFAGWLSTIYYPAIN